MSCQMSCKFYHDHNIIIYIIEMATSKGKPEDVTFHDFREEDTEPHDVVYSDPEDDYGMDCMPSARLL